MTPVEISLTEDGSGQLAEALQTRKLDVAFAGMGTTPPQGIATRIVADEAVVAATGLGDELATRTSIGLEALRTRALIILPPGTGLRSRVDAACAKAHGPGLHVLSITRPRMRGRIALAWRATGPMSPAAQALIGYALATLC